MRFSLLLLAAAAAFAAPRPADIPFKKIQLDYGANETAAFADLNGDGKLDEVDGEPNGGVTPVYWTLYEWN